VKATPMSTDRPGAIPKIGEDGRSSDRSVPSPGALHPFATPWPVYPVGSIILLTMLSYWVFPGHLYLYEDTQIYLPMIEHLWDPSVLQRDILATRPHLAFTIYDEVALFLKGLTGLEFREVLTLQQWIFRAIGIFGIYLLARAMKLSLPKALSVAGFLTLGATVVGSGLSTLEFEPIPRSFAFPLILLAMGQIANGRYLAGGVAGAIAFLYHPPIGYPFWLVFLVLVGCACRQPTRKEAILGVLPLICAGAVLFVLSRSQVAMSPPEPLFRRLDPLQEQLQSLLAPYNWISTWPFRWIEHHLFLGTVAGLAFWRLRRSVGHDLRFFLVGLPLVSILSMPASYVLLEKLKWSFVPQFQPMRALVYLAVVTALLTTTAGIKAIEEGRFGEGLLWLLVAFAIPTEARVLHILVPRLSSLAIPEIRRRVVLVMGFALFASVAFRAQGRGKRWAGVTLAACVLAPFFLLGRYGKVNQFAPRNSPELEGLARWARSSTPKDAVFLFPDAGHDIDPTIFRAAALRAVYVDWKSNGQVNFFRDFTREWWRRWQTVSSHPFDPRHLEDYSSLGIDYLVVQPSHHIPGGEVEFENSRYAVYAVKQLNGLVPAG